ncbi:fatty-acyl-CoA synthase [Microdochium nivale]|nr:fatty-acyl-CoA synthase [Microdochium nivale]
MASQSRNRLSRPVLHWDNVHPDNTACVDLETGQRWTFSALDAAVDHAISQLRAGFPCSPPDRATDGATRSPVVRRGDRVAIVAKNNVRHIILFLAAMRMGVVFVPLSWRLPPRELQRLLADCTPTVLIAEDLGPLREVLPAGCCGVGLEDLSIGLLESSPVSDPEAVHNGVCAKVSDSSSATELDDTCLILYTSGSTGLPKGVQHTPRSLHATAVNFAASASISAARPPVLLVDLPMSHVIGAVVCTLAPLHLGGTVLVSSKFDAERTNSRLADADLGVSHYFCVPTMADALRSAPSFQPAKWQKLEQLLTGGSPNPASSVRWWLDRGIKMLDGYGMTETGTICTMPMSHNSVEDVVRVKAGSVGLPGPLTEIRMVDSQGCDVPRGSPGEMLVSGDHVSPGYWRARAEEQAAASLATATTAPSKTWFPTGDVAVQDADGFIYIVDRKKDVYISGGENVYPSEVEAALCEHPLLRDVAVVSMLDDVWGEVGCAFVVAASSDKAIEDGELQDHCRERLAPYKIPKRFVRVEALPRNAAGKVLKHVLRDQSGFGATMSREPGVSGTQSGSGSGRAGLRGAAWLGWCSAMPRGGLLRDQGRRLLSFVGKLLRLLVGSF